MPPGRMPQGQTPLRLLHQLSGLLIQVSRAERSSGVRQRREQQRLTLMQRLLDPPPAALIPPLKLELEFWRALRWGSAGMLLALWLRG